MDIGKNQKYRGRVQAVILDWAGTGVDHGCFGPIEPIVRAFAEQGVRLEISEARGPMGMAKKDHIRTLLADPNIAGRWLAAQKRPPDEGDVGTVYKQAEKHMLRTVADYATPVPGAVEALREFRSMDLKIGSCTGYTSAMMKTVTESAAALGYAVDCTLTADMVGGKGRPFPFMIYENAVRLGVWPLEAIIKIGDTPVDIQEGLNAGVWTIGVTHSGSHVGLSREELAALSPAAQAEKTVAAERILKDAGAHFVVPYLSDCAELIAKINRNLEAGLTPAAPSA